MHDALEDHFQTGQFPNPANGLPSHGEVAVGQQRSPLGGVYAFGGTILVDFLKHWKGEVA